MLRYLFKTKCITCLKFDIILVKLLLQRFRKVNVLAGVYREKYTKYARIWRHMCRVLISNILIKMIKYMTLGPKQGIRNISQLRN